MIEMEQLELSLDEMRELTEYEKVIQEGKAIFLAVGAALLEINKKRLYRATHPTFEIYLRDRWEMSRTSAYRLVDAYEISQKLIPVRDQLPTNEAQFRPLASVPEAIRQDIWRASVETAADGKITAKHIKATTAKFYQLDDLNSSMPYSEYLQTEWWKKLSFAVKWLHNFECALCKSSEKLNAHHNNYNRKGKERPEDMICLCQDCHSKFHDKEVKL